MSDLENITKNQLLKENDFLKKQIFDLKNSITKHQPIRKKLEESEEKFKAIFDSIDEAIFIHDSKTGVILDVNNTMCKMYGYTEGEVVGLLNIQDLSSNEAPYTQQHALEWIKKIKPGKPQMFEWMAKHKSGQLFWVEVNMTQAIIGQQEYLLVVVRNIDERKKTEKEITQLKIAVEQSANAVVITNIEGAIEYTNPQFTKLTGYTAKEVLGENPRILNSKSLPEKYYAEMWQTITAGKAWKGEFYNKKKNGELFWENVTITPIKNETGLITNYLAIKEDITKIKAAEKAQKESEEKYKFLATSTLDVIWTTDLDLKTTYINDAIFPLLGYTAKEFLNCHPSLFINEEGLYKLGKLKETILKTAVKNKKKKYKLELKYKRKDGQIIDTELSANPIFDKSGNISGFQGRTVDISERKRAEQELLRSEERFNLAMKASSDGLYDWNLVTNEVYYSDAWKNMLGYKDDELPNELSVWESLSHPEERDKSLIKFKSAIDKKVKQYDVEFRMKHKLGQWVNILSRAQLIYDSEGKAIRVVGTHADLTKQKQAELELIKAKDKAEDNESMLNTFINSIPDIVCFKDGEGRWLLANQADLELFCLENVDYHNKTDAELADYTDEIYREAFLTCMISDEESWKKKELSHGVETIPTINGENKVYDVIKVPIFYPNGQRKGLAVIGRDITELAKTQNNLLISKDKAEESDQLKSAFLANMSHEIRTPMNGILGFAELLKQPDISHKDQQHFVDIIENSGKRMLNIINDLIDISKIEAGQTAVVFTEIELNKQLEYIYTFFKPEVKNKGLQLHYKHGLSSPDDLIYSDREKIYAILMNLVKNAIKYTLNGSITFGYEKINNTLQFYVKDTGIGIPKARQNAIFDRFVQADIEDKQAFEGAGLGLSISKAYVEMLKGEIGLESIEGEGSLFYFTIPCQIKKNKLKENIMLKSKQTPEAKKLNILIVEDDQISEFYLATLVKNINKKILYAETGLEAVEICKKNTNLDLILMDIKMPEMNGFDATRKIRTFNKNIIIIAQTAFALPNDKANALKAGCNDYISKPINKDKLVELIWKHF